MSLFFMISSPASVPGFFVSNPLSRRFPYLSGKAKHGEFLSEDLQQEAD